MISIYSNIDKEIIRLIGKGVDTFSDIWTNRELVDVCNKENIRSDKYRLVDRRLQILRKKGLIKFEKGHWRVL